MTDSAVLVLNRHFQPIHVTNAKRAFSLLYLGVARVIDREFKTFDFDSWAQLSEEMASGDVIKTVNVTKANDQPEGVLTMFKLEPFDFEPDEDGNPFQVAIVSADIIPTGGQQGSKRQKPTDRQTLALRALAEVVLSRGQDPPPSYQLPLGIKVVTLRDWEEELYRSNVLDRDGSNVRARFKELRESLASRFLIGMRDIWVWSAARPV